MIELVSVITCPSCGGRAEAMMPTDACVYLFVCPGCGITLKPRPGHCCVFCSYGSVPCPPEQGEAGGGCSSGGEAPP